MNIRIDYKDIPLESRGQLLSIIDGLDKNWETRKKSRTSGCGTVRWTNTPETYLTGTDKTRDVLLEYYDTGKMSGSIEWIEG